MSARKRTGHNRTARMSYIQRSLHEQLIDLLRLANEHGLYDAADWLVRTRRWLEEDDRGTQE